MAVVNITKRPAAKRAGLAALLSLGLSASALAGESSNQVFAARAAAEYQRAQTEFQSSTNPAAAWQFARACFDFADFATNNAERAAIANQGIAACRQLLARDTNSAPGHCYLAMNFGQLARAEAPSLAAYHLIREIEREFKLAAQADARLDYACPERGLGLLYRDAPGWPISIGSKHKARNFLEQAAKLAPDYPENHLNLAESYLLWHEGDEARAELKTLDTLWPAAQKQFAGEAWERSWDDWAARRDHARKKLDELSKPPRSGR